MQLTAGRREKGEKRERKEVLYPGNGRHSTASNIPTFLFVSSTSLFYFPTPPKVVSSANNMKVKLHFPLSGYHQ